LDGGAAVEDTEVGFGGRGAEVAAGAVVVGKGVGGFSEAKPASSVIAITTTPGSSTIEAGSVSVTTGAPNPITNNTHSGSPANNAYVIGISAAKATLAKNKTQKSGLTKAGTLTPF